MKRKIIKQDHNMNEYKITAGDVLIVVERIEKIANHFLIKLAEIIISDDLFYYHT